MADLEECLLAILHERTAAASPDEKGLVTLSEKRERGRSSMRVQVRDVPSTAIIISLQKSSQHPILRQSQGQSWMKICDYMLVDHGQHGCEIVMVELKSTLQKRSEGLEQLRRSLPIAKYVLAVCEVELRRSWPCQFSYVLIAEKQTSRLNKQPIRPRPELRMVDYEGIKVSIGVGTRFDFAALTADAGRQVTAPSF